MALSFEPINVRNAWLDAITAAIGPSGLLKIFSGTRPASGGAATTLLVSLPLAATAAPAAAGAVLTFGPITTTNAVATGAASWFRITKSDGTTWVIDGDVGTSGSDLNLNTTALVTGGPIAISSFVLTAGNP